jgi:hypothetical protein
MLGPGFRYAAACGIGAVVGLFVAIFIRHDLTLGAACLGTAIGAFFGGLVPVIFGNQRVATLPFALASFTLSVILATVVGVAVGGTSPFMWECLILGCLVGVSLSIPMAVHALVYRFLLSGCGGPRASVESKGAAVVSTEPTNRDGEGGLW